MKKYFSTVVIMFATLVFYGCATKEIRVKDVALCQKPIVKININSITSKKNSINFNQEKLKEIVSNAINTSNCVSLVPKAEGDSEDVYVANIVYGIYHDEKQKDGFVSSKIQDKISVEVTINLNNKDQILSFTGKTSVNMDGTKILGIIGEDVNLSDKDNEVAIQTAVQTALDSFVKYMMTGG